MSYQKEIRNFHNDEKFCLLTHLWPQITRNDFNTYGRLYNQYFSYLEEQVLLVQRKPTLYAVATVSDIFKLVQKIQVSANGTKSDICPNGSGKAFNSLDIAIRAWLTVYVEHSTTQSPSSLRWPADTQLSTALENCFTPSQNAKDKIFGQVPVDLSIPNLIRYYNFNIKWTSDLLQHLKIDWKHRKITIFEHGICLRNHIKYPETCPLPETVILEAIDTLILLFPNNKTTNEFLSAEGRTFLEVPYGRQRCLPLENYSYWRQNLSELVDYWEEGPKGWSQIRLKPDRGNLLEYVTFWAATTVLILTILSIAFGVASIVLAKKALDVSVRSLEVSIQSYNLALSIACREADTKELLPEFCV